VVGFPGATGGTFGLRPVQLSRRIGARLLECSTRLIASPQADIHLYHVAQ